MSHQHFDIEFWKFLKFLLPETVIQISSVSTRIPRMSHHLLLSYLSFSIPLFLSPTFVADICYTRFYVGILPCESRIQRLLYQMSSLNQSSKVPLSQEGVRVCVWLS